MNIKPNFLQKGDYVAIISTARKITKEEVSPAKELLEEWGLIPVLGTTIGMEDRQFAGTDEQRATDFQNMMDDPKIKAIWCARGGYGTVRMIDLLNFEQFKNNPKWVIGYSDVTVLHSHLNTLGIVSLHATMPLDMNKISSLALTSLKNALFGKPIAYETLGTNYDCFGEAQGELVGGNLSILYSLLGSKSAINTHNKILFLEDLDEYLYHIDRMLMNLKRNGYFNHIKGLIIGGMTSMHDNNIPFGKNVSEIVCDILSDQKVPICFNFPAGHVSDNRTLILGKKIRLSVNEKINITFD